MSTKSRLITAAVVAATSIVSYTASAAESDSSVALFGQYTKGEADSRANVNSAYERFFAGHRLGVSTRLGITYSENETTSLVQVSPGRFANRTDTTSSLTTTFGIGADFYFTEMGRDGAFVPFVGVGVDYGSTAMKDADSLSFYSAYAEAGFKYFLSERASLDTRVQYKINEYSVANAKATSEQGVLFGLSVYF